MINKIYNSVFRIFWIFISVFSDMYGIIYIIKHNCLFYYWFPGKTAAFMLPILERLLYRPKQAAATRVLVLSPTRELAVQIHTVARQLAQFTNVEISLSAGIQWLIYFIMLHLPVTLTYNENITYFFKSKIWRMYCYSIKYTISPELGIPKITH
jgi:hypothetical protein